MMRCIISSAFLAVWLCLSVFAADEAEPSLPARVDATLPNVLLIGDSISAGYLPFVRDQLAGFANVYRIPTNGGDTSKGRRELTHWLRTGGVTRWDVIHFNFGLHDIKERPSGETAPMTDGFARTTSLDDYRANLEQLCTELLATGARVLFATTTPVPPVEVSPRRKNGDVIAYNAAARAIVSARRVAIVDLYTAAASHLREWQRPANVHFTSAGSESLGRHVAAAIRNALQSPADPRSSGRINSVGMKLVTIPAGEFRMGNEGEIDYTRLPKAGSNMPGYRGKGQGEPPLAANPLEWDEAPAHMVYITRSFEMAATPVTNAQFERYRPEHRALRGRQGFSRGDDDAALFVNWHDAVAFCAWLSEREGRNYRLPTEAEWEYACRAGSGAAFFTGAELPLVYHRHQVMDREHALVPEKVSLTVGATPPNAWGLHDMHGLVEEWCRDWYGPYRAEPAADPVGRAAGIARVTRGGSHSTGIPFLRAANRCAALPDTRTYAIGFRVVVAPEPEASPLPVPPTPRWAQAVDQRRAPVARNATVEPVFLEPRTYTRVPADANGPLYITHNHCPSLTLCPNGDLLAVWFTTIVERGREMVIAGSRLRRGAKVWDEPDVFFHVADRNLTGSALWWDGEQTLYHANGVGVGDDYRNLAIALRTSTDNGVSWTAPRLIRPEHQSQHQVIDTLFRASDGTLALACDATHEGAGGTVVYLSRDEGRTWTAAGAQAPRPTFAAGTTGAWIAGIHGGIVELRNGQWLALGRGNEMEGQMPMSLSRDGGRTWEYRASGFEPIGSAQRLELLRLREGPILLLSFAKSLVQRDARGEAFEGRGMFAALSFDEGKTWPVRKLITPGEPRRVLDAPCNRRWGEEFSVLDRDRAETRGYLTGVQAPDGMIHVLSSGTHYAFNLAWIETPPPARP